MTSQGEAVDMRDSSPRLAMAKPRSRRVGMASPPSDFTLSSLMDDSSSPPPSPASLFSPPLPVRSPLRPPPRSITGSSTASGTTIHFRRPSTPPPLDIDDFAAIAEAALPLHFHMQDRTSFPSLSGLMDSFNQSSDDSLLSKALPIRPDSPLSMSLVDDEALSSSSSLAQPAMTKRQHALHELLSSERAYASDLALIRGVHIPLALGHSTPIHPTPVTPPHSSASSSRTLSTASDSSTASLGPPMSVEDTKIIFSNIAELALFSDSFCQELEEALGSVVEGGYGEDHVGALFLEIIPKLERPYKYYITRHPTALSHLQSLSQSPALTAYLAHTQTIACSLSHAWDLSSLLIKPVQRLLKYPLLLAAIIDETPDNHRDKENLKLARQRLEEVARNVNEGRRRAEVVKEVLTSKKKPVNVAVTASVNLGKMKSLRHVGGRGGAGQPGGDENGEAVQVERMQAELKRIDVFAQQFARNVVEWARSMNTMVRHLRIWAVSFGKVIGLSTDQESEAFDAFMLVVERQLMPLCVDLDKVITERLLKEIAHLLMTMNQPLKLLASMNEQEPLHYHLLNMNVSSKNRPPAALLAASTNYVALRGQLAAELPQYLGLLHTGMAVFVRRLAAIQTEFWGDIRDRWAELWDMLRVEGEMNAGHEMTTRVWQERWADVDEVMGALNINQTKKLYQEPIRPPTSSGPSMMSALEPRSSASSSKWSQAAPSVMNMLSSLEPAHAVGPYMVSSPFPLTPSKGRARGASDASTTKRTVGRRASNESLRSGKTHKTKSPRRRTDEFGEYVVMPMGPPIPSTPMIPRTKSMPLPPLDHVPMSSNRSSSSSKTLVDSEYTRSQHEPSYDERERGRTSRKPSFKRKIVDTFRTPSGSRQRSGSTSNAAKPLASPTSASFFPADIEAPPFPNPRDSWVTKRAKYVCRVVHACKPPAAVSYYSYPFFTLIEGQLYQVLQETGHPSLHPKLPLYVDDGEDCLLLCRDDEGNVGWALASFLAPLSD